MDPDIELYIDSSFAGFFPYMEINERLEEYTEAAFELAQQIDWDEVILYAIFSYENDSDAIIAADLMLLRMTYDMYRELCRKISKNCRLFFFNNSKEIYYEN